MTEIIFVLLRWLQCVPMVAGRAAWTMGDQSKNGSDPNQGLQMPDYATANMVASSQSPMTMSMAQSCIAGLPALAPAPPTSHQQQQLAPAPHNSHLQQHTIQTSQIQQIHPGNVIYS